MQQKVVRVFFGGSFPSCIRPWFWFVCLKGVDSDGVPYEEQFCGGSKPRGIILFGDSAGAHFHIPAKWLYAPMLTEVRVDIFLLLPEMLYRRTLMFDFWFLSTLLEALETNFEWNISLVGSDWWIWFHIVPFVVNEPEAKHKTFYISKYESHALCVLHVVLSVVRTMWCGFCVFL